MGNIHQSAITPADQVKKIGRKIKKYWKGQGYNIEVSYPEIKVETMVAGKPKTRRIVYIETNLVNGLPPDYDGELVYFGSH